MSAARSTCCARRSCRPLVRNAHIAARRNATGQGVAADVREPSIFTVLAGWQPRSAGRGLSSAIRPTTSSSARSRRDHAAQWDITPCATPCLCGLAVARPPGADHHRAQAGCHRVGLVLGCARLASARSLHVARCLAAPIPACGDARTFAELSGCVAAIAALRRRRVAAHSRLACALPFCPALCSMHAAVLRSLAPIQCVAPLGR